MERSEATTHFTIDIDFTPGKTKMLPPSLNLFAHYAQGACLALAGETKGGLEEEEEEREKNHKTKKNNNSSIPYRPS